MGWTQEKADSGNFYTWKPLCEVDKSTDKCTDSGQEIFTLYLPTRPNATVLWLLIGGFLVGLGAPFWAKTINSLTQARGAVQSLRSIGRSEQAPAAGTASATEQDDTPEAKFKHAQKASSLATS